MCEAARNSGMNCSREEQQKFPPVPGRSFQSDLALWQVQVHSLPPALTCASQTVRVAKLTSMAKLVYHILVLPHQSGLWIKLVRCSEAAAAAGYFTGILSTHISNMGHHIYKCMCLITLMLPWHIVMLPSALEQAASSI